MCIRILYIFYYFMCKKSRTPTSWSMTSDTFLRYNIELGCLSLFQTTKQWRMGSAVCQTRVDLYRSGRGNDPGLNNVRPGKEYITDSQGNKVVSPGMGLSTFTSITQPGRWWKLPAGSPIPVGLHFTNDHGNHYLIEPVKTISVDDYVNLVMQTSSYWKKV